MYKRQTKAFTFWLITSIPASRLSVIIFCTSVWLSIVITCTVIWPDSYTHLDVYKRQLSNERKGDFNGKSNKFYGTNKMDVQTSYCIHTKIQKKSNIQSVQRLSLIHIYECNFSLLHSLLYSFFLSRPLPGPQAILIK